MTCGPTPAKNSAQESLQTLLKQHAPPATAGGAACDAAAKSRGIQRQDISHLRQFLTFVQQHLQQHEAATLCTCSGSVAQAAPAPCTTHVILGRLSMEDAPSMQLALYTLYRDHAPTLCSLLLRFIAWLSTPSATTSAAPPARPVSTGTLGHKIRRLAAFIKLSQAQEAASTLSEPQAVLAPPATSEAAPDPPPEQIKAASEVAAAVTQAAPTPVPAQTAMAPLPSLDSSPLKEAQAPKSSGLCIRGGTAPPLQVNLLDRHHPIWSPLYDAIHGCSKEPSNMRQQARRKRTSPERSAQCEPQPQPQPQPPSKRAAAPSSSSSGHSACSRIEVDSHPASCSPLPVPPHRLPLMPVPVPFIPMFPAMPGMAIQLQGTSLPGPASQGPGDTTQGQLWPMVLHPGMPMPPVPATLVPAPLLVWPGLGLLPHPLHHNGPAASVQHAAVAPATIRGPGAAPATSKDTAAAAAAAGVGETAAALNTVQHAAVRSSSSHLGRVAGAEDAVGVATHGLCGGWLPSAAAEAAQLETKAPQLTRLYRPVARLASPQEVQAPAAPPTEQRAAVATAGRGPGLEGAAGPCQMPLPGPGPDCSQEQIDLGHQGQQAQGPLGLAPSAPPPTAVAPSPSSPSRMTGPSGGGPTPSLASADGRSNKACMQPVGSATHNLLQPGLVSMHAVGPAVKDLLPPGLLPPLLARHLRLASTHGSQKPPLPTAVHKPLHYCPREKPGVVAPAPAPLHAAGEELSEGTSTSPPLRGNASHRGSEHHPAATVAPSATVLGQTGGAAEDRGSAPTAAPAAASSPCEAARVAAAAVRAACVQRFLSKRRLQHNARGQMHAKCERLQRLAASRPRVQGRFVSSKATSCCGKSKASGDLIVSQETS